MRQFDTAPAPHLPRPRSVTRLMLWVLLALVPGTVAQTLAFGPGVLLQIALATLFALAIEAAMLRLRGRPLAPALGDLSAPVTAVLFALCIPPLAPWWIALLGMLAAIACAKHLYGGLGHNLFNPAMVGYAVVLVSFPLAVSQWPTPAGALPLPDLWASLQTIATGQLPPPFGWDALAQATPLDGLRQGLQQGATLRELHAALPDSGAWRAIALAHAGGGLLLVGLRIVPWQMPVAVLGSVALVSGVAAGIEPDLHPDPWTEWTTGALMLGAFFIASDPVSGCTTPRGRWLFGAGVGLLTLALRRWSSYPDGVAFAVLLMNCVAPWLDLHTRPRLPGAPR